MMNYTQALEYIHSVNWTFCKPGLERIAELCSKLGNPQKGLKFIHIAGTNGKGSFCSMIASVLIKSGLRTGVFTSPYVVRFNERMRINNEDISDDELARLIERIKPIADNMTDKPTEFELITAAAFLYFYENACDIVVLECGLGGRLDSTNIIENPILSVITGIALDHTYILGDTIEQIAAEKAGIIKSGRPVLWCGRDESAEAVIREKAENEKSPFYISDKSSIEIKEFSLNGTCFNLDEFKDIKIKLLGEYQIDNAANVLNAVRILRNEGVNIPKNAVYAGMESALWPSRFEIINKDPLIIADGGHNPEGILSAVESVKKYFGGKRVNVLSGVMTDKDYRFIAKAIGEIANKVYCVTPDNPRALSADDYAEVYKELGIGAQAFESVKEAFFAAAVDAKLQDTALITLGSLYMYSEIVKSNGEFCGIT